MKLKKRIFAVMVALVLTLGALWALAASSYPSAIVVFSGIEMITNPADGSTQGFVDITLKEMKATGVSFCMKYDTNLIQLSDYTSNEEITNPVAGSGSPYNMEHAYFEQDRAFFPEDDTFMDNKDGFNVNVSPVIGVADAERGYLIMNFLPNFGSEDLSDYIELDEYYEEHIMAEEQDVCFGRISFRIKSPQEFSKLTEAEIENLLQIVPFTEADMTTMDTENLDGNKGIQMSYWDETEERMLWYNDSERNIDYEINITARLTRVYADQNECTVSAYEIYRTGTSQDLLDFVNEKAGKLILEYADGSFVPAMMEWTALECNLDAISWNPAGGDYTLTQAFGEHEVSVTVHVTPVTLTGFIAENENRTMTQAYVREFLAQDFDTTGASPLDVLAFPTDQVTPVLEPYQYTGGLPDMDVLRWIEAGAAGEISALPVGFGDDVPATYTFYGVVGSVMELTQAYPWLTVPDPVPEVQITRTVVASEEEMPKKLEASAVNVDGTVTITVSYAAAEDGNRPPIPENTEFFIRMPGGTPIDADVIASLESHSGYSVTYNADDTATIVLEPDYTIEAEATLAAYINLGARAGNFTIAAREADPGPITDYAPCTVPATANYYLAAPASMASTPNYTFDYSTVYAALFPVKAGSTLPNTITLPLAEKTVTTADNTETTESQRIGTTYNGITGAEPGALTTFTVESWATTTDTSSGSTVVTAVGTLADTYYTNYGTVTNPNGITVTLLYLEVADPDLDSIQVTTLDAGDNFTYDPQQEGYGNDRLQTATFTAQNVGSADIHGLSVKVSLTNDNNYEGFALTRSLPEILEVGDSAEFDIKTKKGLPAGTHVATVTLYSNNVVLDTFTLTFVITEQPVYRITIIVAEDPSYGTAVTASGIYTAMAGDPVSLIAAPADPLDYTFEGWTVDLEEVVITNATQLNAMIEHMPDKDIVITATFKEGTGAFLRLDELRISNTQDSVTYDLLDTTSWVMQEFDPLVREYNVVVPSEVDEVLLHFMPREEARIAQKDLFHIHEDVPEPLTISTTDNITWISETVILHETPTKTVLGLRLSMDGEERSYTVNVYRKIAPSKLMTFRPGNSPRGLIEQAPNISDKDAAWQQFVTDGYMFTAANCPDGQETGIIFTPHAWTSGISYDADAAALFVDTTQPFADPGYESVQNSLGEPVTEVTKTVTVNLLAESDPAKQNGSSEEFEYIRSETIPLANSGMLDNLVGKRIRPDVYAITYSFADYDGSIVSVTKPLILLTPIGDVNISGIADDSDTTRILSRFSTDIANQHNVSDYVVGGNVFKFRVCDVNRDGNLNAIDANMIRAGLLTSFYMNPDEGGGGA